MNVPEPSIFGTALAIMLNVFAPAAEALPAWSPNDGPQREFVESECREILYGGAAGGGKSFGLVGIPIPWIGHADLRTLFLRRTTDDLRDIFDKAKRVYKQGSATGPKPFQAVCPDCVPIHSAPHEIRAPSGAKMFFGHCNDVNDWEKYQGQEYQIIGFDELTQFTERQYLEISSRCRSASPGLPRLIRATSNPGGKGHGWVFRRWKYWLDPSATIPGRAPRYDETGKLVPPAKPGEVLWIRREDDGSEFISTATDPLALSRTFIPARLDDNPVLVAEDPAYRASLRDFDPVRRAQLERGDWLVKPAAGLFFKRGWFEVVARAPEKARRVRFWDYAATAPSDTNPDPDWTRGLKLSLDDSDGYYYVEHVASIRAAPGQVDALVEATAKADGRTVSIRKAQDPASAGKREGMQFIVMLEGYDVGTTNERGDKVTRSRTTSAQCSPKASGDTHGRFRVVRGDWNDAFFAELEEFPDGDHDDFVDALAGAHSALLEGAGHVHTGTDDVVATFDHETMPMGFG